MGSDHHQQWRQKEQSQPLSQGSHKKSLSSAEFFKIMYLLYLPCQANLSSGGMNSKECNMNFLMSPTTIMSIHAPTYYFVGLKTETTCAVQILLLYMQ